MMFIFKNKVRIIPHTKVQEKSNELSQESQIMLFKVVQGHEQ